MHDDEVVLRASPASFLINLIKSRTWSANDNCRLREPERIDVGSARGPTRKMDLKQSVTCSAEIITVKWTSRWGSQRPLAACVLTEETMATAGIDFLPVPPQSMEWLAFIALPTLKLTRLILCYYYAPRATSSRGTKKSRPDSREILRATESPRCLADGALPVGFID